MNDGTVTNKKDTFEKHPVEAGEVEEVGEGEGGAEEGLGEVDGREVVPGEGEDPVEGGQAKGSKQAHVDLVPQTSHLPAILFLPCLESRSNFTLCTYVAQTICFP